MPTGDFPDPEGMVWTDAAGWVPRSPTPMFVSASVPLVRCRERNPEIIAQPPSALRVIALSIGIEIDEARAIVRALAKAGYIVAPMEPTNAMFAAYVEALGAPSKKYDTVIQNIGKARKRWKAMAHVGMIVAFSKRDLTD